ncbi:hypothetical protein [Haloferula sp.]|uniref:hypothetical protein n=1 Tax=Haloferula sp. TaxID=2497595 RepID=UPI00329FCF8F
MPKRLLFIAIALLIIWLGVTFFSDPSGQQKRNTTLPAEEAPPTFSEDKEDPSASPLPGDTLLDSYASEDTEPIDDLRKINRLLGGYFSVIKDQTKYPIGGNADLAACLLGENANRMPFLRPDHPALNSESLLIDRWGTPLSVHPEAAREITLRSAGPDRTMFTDDDLILLPNGEKP